MRFSRAQSTLEFLAILSVALFITVAVIILTNQQIVDVGKYSQASDMRSAARDLASAANQVYLQGAGARKLVMVRLPQGYDPSQSFIANNTVKLSYYGSDYLGHTDVDVQGSLPSSAGTHYLWVVARQGYVTIGPRSIVYIPGLIMVSASAANYSQSKNTTLTATNEGNESLNVSLSLDWNHTHVNVSFFSPSDQHFQLDGGDSRQIQFISDIGASAVGVYSGYINAAASNGETDQIDFIVEITPLTCTPTNCTGGSGACPPHKIKIQTYYDSLYSTPHDVFDQSQAVKITSLDWSPSDNITIDIKDPLYASVPGFPQVIQANSSGGLYLEWIPAGQPSGAYSVIASNSFLSTNYSFTLTSCT